MRVTVLIALVASAVAFASDHGGAIPPVLRPLEPADSGVFRLPGPAAEAPKPVVPKFRSVKVAAPVPQPSPLSGKLVFAPLPPLPVAPPVPSVPPAPAVPARSTTAKPSPMPVLSEPALVPPPVVVEPSKPVLPPEAAQELAFFCQKQIGHWTEADARKLLGLPLRSRAALDERKKANGRIYAFHDPTSRYRELELDFEGRTGALRTVFVYPHRMTLQDVRQRWRGEVSAADAPEGRKFYSYGNRKLDVLVDADGKVISLGLY